MKKVNLVFSILFLVAFAASGQYMRHVLGVEQWDDLTARMEIRSNHIYLLFIGLLNAVVFRVTLSNHRFTVYFDVLFRILLIVAGGMALLAFWHDHNGDLFPRKFTYHEVLFSLIAVGLVGVNEIVAAVSKKKP